VDTLKLISDENPTADLYLLMGADALESLPQWKAPEVICRLATLVVAGRPGSTVPDFGCLTDLASAKRIAKFEANQVKMPLIGLSSSILRKRLADGESIRYQTPRPVEKYIETHGLYKKK
ncbi:MAG: nicotinic acid mononucleotide adenylyltransferase, partial [Planctomycetales bacterium]